MPATQGAMTSEPSPVGSSVLAGILVLLLLAACARDEPRRQGPATTLWPTGAACMSALAARGIEVAPWAAPKSGNCVVDRPVTPVGAPPLLSPPPRTSCSMLLAWATFEPVIDELAQRHLGSPLRSIQTYGSHACRRMTGNRSRASLHASARAMDIAAFELADGKRISVQKDWHGRGAATRFLKAVALAACERFSVVLTPETDRLHEDHLHVDIGPWKVCDA
jgi:hypothetical protein